MSASTPCALGLDVGGTKIAGGIVLFPQAQVIERKIIPTQPERGGERILADVISLVEELRAAAGSRGLCPAALGLGLAELVDRQGNIASAATIHWQELPVHARLSALLPTFFEADVRAAARAEAVFGAGLGFRHFLYVTVGTGISSCLVLEQEPYPGARGLAGTFASSSTLSLGEDGLPRTAPPLESIASGPGLAARLRAIEPGFSGTALEVCARANQGDPVAGPIVETAARCLGAAIAQLINVLDPEAVVLGGGLGLAGGHFRENLEPTMRAHCWSALHRNIPLLEARTGTDAGLIGGAWAAFSAQEKTNS
jgi:glucokinase